MISTYLARYHPCYRKLEVKAIMINIIFIILLGFFYLPSHVEASTICSKPYVSITGYAKAFIGDQRIENATITILEMNRQIKTDQSGRFCFCAIPGSLITLQLERSDQLFWHNYQPTQTATFIVPKKGFIGPHHEITFQVPRKITYKFLKSIIVHKLNAFPNSNCCQVAATITAKDKTLADDVQGEVNAKVILSHRGKVLKYINVAYFGILFKKTNPFVLQGQSSLDGGVIIYNLPASKFLYSISAIKTGKQFSREYFYCRPNTFINLSPPHGINVIN